MSTFMVENRAIDEILTPLFYDDSNFHFLKEEIIKKKYGYNLVNAGEIQRLGQDFLNMNREAVNYRYEKDTIPRIYTFSLCEHPLIQSYKSARCLRYQCDEGNVPDSKTYKCLNEIIETFGSQILGEFPEYQQASWG